MGRTQKWPAATGQPPPAATPDIPVGDGTHSASAELVGYARVSTRSQNDDSQVADLTAAGCSRIFIDHGVSGKLASRPELDKAVAYLRPGDTLVITRLSRAMRSLRHLLNIAHDLKERGIELKVLRQDIDTTTATGRLTFNILAAIDEWLRELIVESTLEGLEAARAKGHHGGRRPKLTPEQEDLAVEMVEGGAQISPVARSMGVSPATVRRALERRGMLPEPGTEAARRDSPSEQDREEILAMLRRGDNYSVVAEATGFSRNTIRRTWEASGARKPPPGAGEHRAGAATGRGPAATPEQARQARRLMTEDGLSHARAAKAAGVTRQALYRALDALDRAERQQENGAGS
jgi:Enterobacteriaceae phage serine recombinase